MSSHKFGQITEKKRWREEEIGVMTARRILEEEAANLSKEMTPLQAQQQLLSEADEVARKKRASEILQKFNMKWVQNRKTKIKNETITNVSATRLKKEPNMRITITREGKRIHEVIWLRQLSTYSHVEWCEMFIYLTTRASGYTEELRKDLERLLEKAKRLQPEFGKEAEKVTKVQG